MAETPHWLEALGYLRTASTWRCPSGHSYGIVTTTGQPTNASVLVYEARMSRQQQRLWQSWEDYRYEWSQHEDFRAALAPLLVGEDPGFVATIQRMVQAAVRTTP